MAVLGLRFCARAFSSCGKRGATLHRCARASQCCGLSCCRAQAPDAQAQQLWLTGPVAPRHVGSSQTRAWTHVPCIGRQTLNHCATREALGIIFLAPFCPLYILLPQNIETRINSFETVRDIQSRISLSGFYMVLYSSVGLYACCLGKTRFHATWVWVITPNIIDSETLFILRNTIIDAKIRRNGESNILITLRQQRAESLVWEKRRNKSLCRKGLQGNLPVSTLELAKGRDKKISPENLTLKWYSPEFTVQIQKNPGTARKISDRQYPQGTGRCHTNALWKKRDFRSDVIKMAA